MKPSSASLWLLVCAAGLAKAEIVFSPDDSQDGDLYRLPEDFLIGAGSSAYQTEGAWNLSGKGESVLDHYFNPEKVSQPYRIANVAADSYHHVDDDIKLLSQLKMYRFSISWTRLLPDGDASKPNPDGIRFYNEIIDKLIANKIIPFVNMYHFDHPLTLQMKYSGWHTEGLIEPYLAFADFAFKTFGDRVKYWTTLNEPNMYCLLGTSGLLGPPPASTATPAEAYYACLRNQLLAHAKAYRMYQQKYAATQGGQVGMTYYTDINRPNTTSDEDVAAAERANAFGIGLAANPVVFGDFPQIVIDQIEKRSKALNRPSWLPKFSDEEKMLLKKSTDFLGANIYHGTTVAALTTAAGDSSGGFFRTAEDAEVQTIVSAEAAGGSGPFGNAFKMSTPWAMRDGLMYTWNNFNNTPIFITENGFEDTEVEGIHDQNRAVYHSEYMRSMLETMKKNGVKVLGMAMWSLIDGLEWSKTTSSKFGLVHVDYSTPERTRTLKDSSAFFVKLAEERRVPLVLPASGSSAWRAHWLGQTLMGAALVNAVARQLL